MILMYLLGTAWFYVFPWRKAKKEQLHMGALECIGFGLLLLIAIFMVGSFLPLQSGMGLTELTEWSVKAGITLIILCLIVLRHHVIRPIAISARDLLDGFKKYTLLELIVLLGAVLAIVLSATVILPHPMESTVESVAFMQNTDSLYMADPYAFALVEPLTVNHSPIAVLYAVVATWIDLPAFVFVEFILPIYLLIGIFGIYRLASKVVFEDGYKQRIFLFFLLIFAFLETLGVDNIVTGVLENPWYGQLLLVVAVIPCAFLCGLLWMQEKQWQLLPAMVALMIAGQTVAAKGFAPVLLSVGVAVAVSLIPMIGRRERHA